MKLENRAYGVEIEFLYKSNMTTSAQRDEIERALQAAGLAMQAEDYNHITRTYWKLIYDVSAGHELVSPILHGEDGFHQIELVCKILNDLGYSVDKTCGLHVHHDARDLSAKQITSVFAVAMKWETVIDWLVAPSRRTGNRYCKSNNQYDRTAYGTEFALKDLRRKGARNYGVNYSDRYLKVNYQAYIKHNTIEFRQHQGTLDAAKMITWILLTQNIVTKAVEKGASYTVSATGICFKRFRDMLGCTGSALQDNAYVKMASKTMLERWNHFTKGTAMTPYTSTLE